MLRALWFIIHLTIFAGLLYGATQAPGTVSIHWLDQTYSLDIGFTLCALYALILLSALLHGIWTHIAGVPKALKRYRTRAAKDAYWRTLTQGLTALAAGDAVSAAKLCTKAEHIHTTHPERLSTGLLTLLSAQTAKLQGDQATATHLFEHLSRDPDAGFLGTRALLQEALDAGDAQKAATLLDAPLKRRGKNPWLTQAAYQTAIHAHDWTRALRHLTALQRAGTLDTHTALSHRVALHIAAYDASKGQALHALKKAHKLSPAFPPILTRLVAHNTHHKRLSRARALLKNAWRLAPHPELAALWHALTPPPKRGEPQPRTHVKWCEQLVALAPTHPLSHLELGKALNDAGLWGDARSALVCAQDLGYDGPEWFYAMAALERAQNSDEDAAQAWLADSLDAQASGWVCNETGSHYREWAPLAKPHNSFNTMQWRPLSLPLKHSLLPVKEDVIGILQPQRTLNTRG